MNIWIIWAKQLANFYKYKFLDFNFSWGHLFVILESVKEVLISLQPSPNLDGIALTRPFISPLYVVLWVSLSGTLRLTLRIVFQSHLVLWVSMRLKLRSNFCFLHYFLIFFSKFWYFIIVINPIILANSKNSLMSEMRSKLPEI